MLTYADSEKSISQQVVGQILNGFSGIERVSCKIIIRMYAFYKAYQIVPPPVGKIVKRELTKSGNPLKIKTENSSAKLNIHWSSSPKNDKLVPLPVAQLNETKYLGVLAQLSHNIKKLATCLSASISRTWWVNA